MPKDGAGGRRPPLSSSWSEPARGIEVASESRSEKILTSPKSVITTSHRSGASSRIFSGLISRWITPCACMKESTSSTWRITCLAFASEKTPRSRMRSNSAPPAAFCITMYTQCGDSAISIIFTTRGCASSERTRHSSRMRCTTCDTSPARPPIVHLSITLIASGAAAAPSTAADVLRRAEYTVAHPPRPSSSPISYPAVKSASELSSVVFAKPSQSTLMCEVSGLEGGTATRSIAMCSLLTHAKRAKKLLCSM